jgi:heme exporter protein A
MGAAGPFREEPKLRVEGLSIARGGWTLFEGLSFSVASGEFVELRGANGAGKTSLLRALAGVLRPREGRVVFEGVDEPAIALHYAAHANGLKSNLTPRAHLRYWAALLGGSAKENDVAQTLSLSRVLDLPCRALSQGQQRRLALARLIVAPRPIWLLDEPAAALDEEGRAVVGTLIASHCASGGLAIAAVHEPVGPAVSQILRLGA